MGGVDRRPLHREAMRITIRARSSSTRTTGSPTTRTSRLNRASSRTRTPQPRATRAVAGRRSACARRRTRARPWRSPSDANLVYWYGKLDALYDKPNVKRVEREVVFVKPLETFIVFDRLEATTSTAAVWQLNSKPTAQQSGQQEWTIAGVGYDARESSLSFPPARDATVVPWSGGFSGGSRLDIASGRAPRVSSPCLAPAGRVQNATTAQSGGNSPTITFAGGRNRERSPSDRWNRGHVTLTGGGLNVDTNLATTVPAIRCCFP